MILPSILDLLARRIGLDVHSIGMPSVELALQERMRCCGISDLGSYRELLFAEETEQDELIELVIVPETWFFRDQAPFQFLALNARRQWGEPSLALPLRLLSLPCSTGAEPYSMAMTLFDAGYPAGTFQIDAVDISEKSLRHARAGIYREHDFRGRNLDVLQRHFIENPRGVFEVKPELRQTVNFTRGTLLEFPLPIADSGYHAVFCRNLLIYLNADWRQRGVEALRRMIRPDGILFVGHADATSALNVPFSMAKDASAFAYYPHVPIATQSQPQPAPAIRARSRKSAAAVATAPKPSDSSAPSDLPSQLREIRRVLDGGDAAAALEQCERILHQVRNNAELYSLAGVAHEQLGQGEAAKEAWQKSLYLEPRHLNSLRGLKCLLEKEGDLPGAKNIAARIRRAQSK
jgi:chemotaxis protein methyltransferase WspC